jgi:phosphonate transport system ATP-binding protein
MNDIAPPPLLDIRNLAVTYSNGHQALQSTNLEIRTGEFVVLLGSSGAGKSTLLRSINGLVTPSAGEVRMADIAGSLKEQRLMREQRRRTGMVFQQHHLIGRQTVLANVLMGRLSSQGPFGSLLPWSKAEKLRALAVIERVGLLDKALARADALSGGQQQRVGIARALIQKPRLMLADEPVASLDPATAENLLALLHSICKTDQLTAVVSLHQVDLARKFADRIIGLSHGRVVFEGTPAALTAATETALYAPSATTSSAVHPLPSPAPRIESEELQAC